MNLRAPHVSRFVVAALSVWLVGTQAACSELTYVTQAAAGQYDLFDRARDIDALVRDRRVDGRMRALLGQIPAMKAFGERHGLRATENYTKYVHVAGPAVVWMVTASEPLRFQAKQWSFPLVGGFTYLGWFHKTDATRFAGELRRQGWDVDVRGASAYSTTGFFEDAVLSSMIPDGKDALGRLADTILHESAHATVFVKHQSTLNESIANFTGDRLAEIYLAEVRGPGAEETRAYLDEERTNAARIRILQAARRELEAVYASTMPTAEKLAHKRAILARLESETHFPREINNATLIQFRTYNSGQAELAVLLEACDGDWPRFLRTLKALEKRKFEREQIGDIGPIISTLAAQGCAR